MSKQFYDPNLITPQLRGFSCSEFPADTMTMRIGFLFEHLKLKGPGKVSSMSTHTHPLLLLVLRDSLPVFLRQIFYLGDVVRAASLRISLKTPGNKDVTFRRKVIKFWMGFHGGFLLNYRFRPCHGVRPTGFWLKLDKNIKDSRDFWKSRRTSSGK